MLAELAVLQVQEHLVPMVPVPYLVLLLQLGEVVVPLFQTLQVILEHLEVVAVVTQGSVQALQLAPGLPVTALVKASDVILATVS